MAHSAAVAGGVQGGDDDIDQAAGGRERNCCSIHQARDTRPGHGSGWPHCRACEQGPYAPFMPWLQRKDVAGLFHTPRADRAGLPLGRRGTLLEVRRRRCDRSRPPRPLARPARSRGWTSPWPPGGCPAAGRLPAGPTPRERESESPSTTRRRPSTATCDPGIAIQVAKPHLAPDAATALAVMARWGMLSRKPQLMRRPSGSPMREQPGGRRPGAREHASQRHRLLGGRWPSPPTEMRRTGFAALHDGFPSHLSSNAAVVQTRQVGAVGGPGRSGRPHLRPPVVRGGAPRAQAAQTRLRWPAAPLC